MGKSADRIRSRNRGYGIGFGSFFLNQKTLCAFAREHLTRNAWRAQSLRSTKHQAPSTKFETSQRACGAERRRFQRLRLFTQCALIGLGGGGIVPLLTTNGIDLDCVDLSPEVIELAKSYFGLAVPPSRVHAADGRVFLQQHLAGYDAVILDVFTGDRLAFCLVTVEGLTSAKQALGAGGLLALNTWGIDLEHGRPNLVGAAIRRTLQQVFRHVLAVPAAGNLLFFASDEPIAPGRESVTLATFDGPRPFTWLPVPPATWPDAPILTDDWNPVDLLDIIGLEKLRVARRTEFPLQVREALAWE